MKLKQKNSINGSNSIVYIITFPNKIKRYFFLQKNVIKYFNKLYEGKNSKNRISPHAVLRGEPELNVRVYDNI